MAYEATPFDKYTTFGLEEAKKLFSSMSSYPQYPGHVSAAQQAPTQMDYYNYTPSQAMQMVAAPQYSSSGGAYRGLMGGITADSSRP